jgi:hypothetical protein
MTYQQKGIWYYEFTFAGKLIRKSSGSMDRAVVFGKSNGLRKTLASRVSVPLRLFLMCSFMRYARCQEMR